MDYLIFQLFWWLFVWVNYCSTKKEEFKRKNNKMHHANQVEEEE